MSSGFRLGEQSNASQGWRPVQEKLCETQLRVNQRDKPGPGALNIGSFRGRAAAVIENRSLHKAGVRLMMSDMKLLTMRELNRKTASVLDAVERGESFELRRNGRAVGYITRTPPTPQRIPDWKAHFNWLRKKSTKDDREALAEFGQERRRHAAREKELGSLK